MPVSRQRDVPWLSLGFCLAVFQAAPAQATPTAAEMSILFDALQTPARYGVVLPAPAVSQNGVVSTAGQYSTPSVFKYNGTWYMLVTYTTPQVGQTVATGQPLLLTAANLQGPWTRVGPVLAQGKTWDSCVLGTSIALQELAWGDNTLMNVNGSYYLSYYAAGSCSQTAPSFGVATSHTPLATSQWARPANALVSPLDSSARSWEQYGLFRSNVIQPVYSTSGFTYLMFMAGGGNGVPQEIGAFGSNDMQVWQRYGTLPVVAASSAYANASTADMQVFQSSLGLYVMNYLFQTGATQQDTFAASDDPAFLTWTAYPDVDPSNFQTYAQPSANLGATGTIVNHTYDLGIGGRPWVLKDSGHVYHFYQAATVEGKTSAVGVGLSMDSMLANGGFEEDGAPAAVPTYWSLDCGVAGEDCDASYTDAGGAQSGAYELTHCKEADYEVSNSQDVNNITNGTYSVSAWVRSSGTQYAATFSLNNDTSVTSLDVPRATSWKRITFPAVAVTTGHFVLTVYSHGHGGDYLHLDNIRILPVGINFSFEQGNVLSQTVPGWDTTGTSPAADYVSPTSGRTGLALAHSSPTAHNVYTAQSLSPLPDGTYTASFWANSQTGCLAPAPNNSDPAAYFEVRDTGGASQQVSIGVTQGWQQFFIPNIHVTSGVANLGFYSNCAGGTSRLFDDIQFYQ